MKNASAQTAWVLPGSPALANKETIFLVKLMVLRLLEKLRFELAAALLVMLNIMLSTGKYDALVLIHSVAHVGIYLQQGPLSRCKPTHCQVLIINH